MNNLNRDITLGILFVSGTWGFISGEFIVSTVMFASAAIISNIMQKNQLKD